MERLRAGVSGVFVGRGVLRNPWILAQARDLMEGRPPRPVSHWKNAAASCWTTSSCCSTSGWRRRRGSVTWLPAGRPWPPRRRAAASDGSSTSCGPFARWYTKGLEGGSQLRIAVNAADSLDHLREQIETFFLAGASATPAPDLVPR